jgi:hypothetical protein
MAIAMACGGGAGGANQPPVPVVPSFNLHPSSQTVTSGEIVTFSVAATGTPSPIFQWERSNDSGASWSVINAGTGVAYSFTTQATDNGCWFRAQATNSAGTSLSHPATLTVTVPDFWVDHATFTQGIIKDGIPLVASKSGVLQVYVVANISTSVKPLVTVDVYQGTTKVRTLSAVPPVNNTPTTPTEAWNVQLTGDDCQSGNTFIVNIDPNNTLSETNKNNNVFPLNGSLSYTFNTLKNFDLTMVPIVLSYGTAGITTSNIHTYTELTRNMLPIGSMTETVHSPFTPSISTAGSDAEWSLIAQELKVIHLAEKPEGDYYGVLHVNPDPSRNPAGGAYFGVRTILGLDPTAWPQPISGNMIIAHEIGHSFSLRHTPCGTGDVNNNPYPYPDGIINNAGIDPETLQTYSANAKDIMGYCNSPEGMWISDYDYNRAYSYRASNIDSPIATHQGNTSFLIWGRKVDGKWILEPSFNLNQTPSLPEPGDLRVEGIVNDRVIFSTKFASADGKGGETFAFTIPGNYDLDALHLYEGSIKVASIHKNMQKPERPSLKAVHSNNGNLAQLKWNSSTNPMAMIMNERGEVIAIRREIRGAVGISDNFSPSGKNYTVHLSNGTGSVVYKTVLDK